MYKIKYVEKVKQNISEIEKNLDKIDKKLTDKILKALNERIQSLQEMPLRYPKYPHKPQFRWTAVHKHIIFYKVCDDRKIVEIHRIIHGARDVKNLM